MSIQLLGNLCCPVCRGTLGQESSGLQCGVCKRQYEIVAGIPILLEPSLANAGGFDYLGHYQKDAEVFDYFEEQTGATEHSERRLREYVLSTLPTTATSFLDVGCGSAWLAKALMKRNVSLCSMDATVINCKKALERYPFSGHTAAVADAFRLPFLDGSFDCVVSTEVIEHVVNPEAFVTELLRVVKPGGSLIISTPYKEVIRYSLCIHCDEQTPINSHLHSFDEQKLIRLAPNASIRKTWHAFNNKLLLFARTYVVLRYLPHSLWRFVDRLANAILPKPVNIIVRYDKPV